MIDLVLLFTDPSYGVAFLVSALASGLVAGAIAVALTLVYGRE
jgi:hypothetical protein